MRFASGTGYHDTATNGRKLIKRGKVCPRVPMVGHYCLPGISNANTLYRGPDGAEGLKSNPFSSSKSSPPPGRPQREGLKEYMQTLKNIHTYIHVYQTLHWFCILWHARFVRVSLCVSIYVCTFWSMQHWFSRAPHALR